MSIFGKFRSKQKGSHLFHSADNFAAEFEKMEKRFLTYAITPSSIKTETGLPAHYFIDLKHEDDPDIGFISRGTIESLVDGVLVKAEGVFSVSQYGLTQNYVPDENGYAQYYITGVSKDGDFQHISLWAGGSFRRCVLSTPGSESETFGRFEDLPQHIKNIITKHKITRRL